MFFTKCRENKVRVRNRQEITLCLRSLSCASAKNSAVTHGDQRLSNLVSGALRIVVRIDKAGQSGFLVRFQYFAALPNHPNRQQADEKNNPSLLPINSAQK